MMHRECHLVKAAAQQPAVQELSLDILTRPLQDVNLLPGSAKGLDGTLSICRSLAE